MGGDYQKIDASRKNDLEITGLLKIKAQKGKKLSDALIQKSEKSSNAISPNKNQSKSTNKNGNNKLERKKEHKKHQKKKKERMSIIAIDKDNPENQELKNLEIIKDFNHDEDDSDLIDEIIKHHFLLQSLDKDSRIEIIKSMSLAKVKKDIIIFKQNSIPFYWYIVHSGELESIRDNKFEKKIKEGESFGEQALINNCRRNSTIITKTECELWILRKNEFQKILKYLSKKNAEENLSFLNNINLPLDDAIKSIMINSLRNEYYNEGDYICKEGEQGNCMYIIKEGEVECIKGDKIIRILKKGDNFGQKALLEGDKRSLDVKAKTDCTVFSISKDFFKTQFGENFRLELYYAFLKIAFSNSEIFSVINPKMIVQTFKSFKFSSFKGGDIIYKKGTKIKEKLCVVLEGNIVDKNTNKVEAKRYEILFENKLTLNDNNDEVIRNNLLAEPDCVIGEIYYDTFKDILGGDLQTAKVKSKQMTTFANVAMFKILSEDKIEFLQNKLKTERFENGKKIITQGEIGDKLYIIKKGRVDFFVNSKYTRSFSDGEDFGAKSLIKSDKRTATAIANGIVECYSLSASDFKSILEPSLLEYFENKFALEDNTIELKDLENIKELGSGNFGFVNLVRNKKNKNLYAIKALNVLQIKKENLETCVELEKNVLLKVDHPFIMKMVKYTKNDYFIFFITEYIKGKELWEVIREIGLLNKIQTQFYGGSMLLAISYLHSKKIIYRDIKPENIMVNTKGYIKIIDFGTVKEIKDRTTTIIGTSHYMAPEVSSGKGYSFEVDIWSIAVCMYEFFCGKLPFGEELEDPMEIYRAVAQDELEFPGYVHDEEFKNLMIKMLKKSPAKRLWKVEQIKEDEYFADFEWKKLISLAMPPPYNVTVKESGDSATIIPYLSYLKTKEVKTLKSKKGQGLSKFDKWLKNF